MDLPEKYKNLKPEHQNVLKKWLCQQNETIDLDKINVITDDKCCNFKVIKKVRGHIWNHSYYTIQDLVLDNKKFQENIEKQKNKHYQKSVRYLDLPPINGYYWISLDKSCCLDYGLSMQSCGRGEISDNIYSLCDKHNTHKITCIVNPQRILRECKGCKNQKPSKFFFPNFKQFILSQDKGLPTVTCYAPKCKAHLDLQISDFSPEEREEILSIKPNFDDCVNFYKKKNYLIVDESVYFNKQLNLEKFKETAIKVWEITGPITRAYVAIAYTEHNLPLPDYVIKYLSTNITATFKFAINANLSLIPKEHLEMIESRLSLDKSTATLYAKYVLKWNNVPEIIKAIL